MVSENRVSENQVGESQVRGDRLSTVRYLEATWPAPKNVRAVVSTRVCGESCGVFRYFNIADHVADIPAHVKQNRALLQQELGLEIAIPWLQQVHGAEVVDANNGAQQRADAIYSQHPGIACAVMTADCLPVLFCNVSGTKVAAAHAGWRGLAAGVLEATAHRFAEPMASLLVWLGPAISQEHFEVGPEVKAQFLGGSLAVQSRICEAFKPSPDKPDYDYADLYELARLRLNALGIEQVYGGDYCTYSQSELFYSYRRDGETGRMASLICLDKALG